MPESRNRLRTIFFNAIEIEDATNRAAYLAEACGADASLRRQVEALLVAEAKASDVPRESAGDQMSFQRETRTSLDSSGNPPPHPHAPQDTVGLVSDQTGDRIGPYKLLQSIGEGGMGVVYMAEQARPVRRRVALKLIKLGMDTRHVIARFEAEGQALALMNHPNIAKVFDVGATAGGRPYMVMELVRGLKITEYCDRHRLSTRQRLELCIQVCQAIQHAHQKGIIHRDLKPSNILVTQNDGVPVCKVIDFGIAKALEHKLTDKTLFTEFQALIGTPAYMSPEQADWSGVDIDTRSDIYALGVLLYALLTGTTPFDSQALLHSGLDEMRRTIREEEPLRPSLRLSTLAGKELVTLAHQHNTDGAKLHHQLRGDLDWIVMKCLEKDRTRRYDTANGLALDIQRYLNHEPILARPPSAAYRLQKFIRRNKLAFTAALTVALALIAGLSVAIWQFLEKNAAYQELVRTADHASRMAEESRWRTIRLNVAYGVRLMDEGDLLSALQWFTEALRLAGYDPARDEIHRTRLGAVRRSCPLLDRIWWHDSGVQYVEFSPGGDRLVTAHEDGMARIWDVASGEQVCPPLQHALSVNSASFSPDSQWILTASEDTTARLWNAQTGQPVGAPLVHAAEVTAARFSPNGDRLVTVSQDGAVRLWDARTRNPLASPRGHAERVESVAFSPDSRHLVTGSMDDTARIWDAQTGEPVGEPLRHQNDVVRAGFSPDGRRVVTASRDGSGRVWDAETGQPVTPPLWHRTWLTDAQFSPDGLTVLTTSFDNTAKLWDVNTGNPVCSPLRHRHSVMRGAFSPDGRHVVTACFDQTAQVWDAVTGERQLASLKHSGYVSQALFSPDGHHILTYGFDRAMRLWDMAVSGSLINPLESDSPVVQTAFSVNQPWVVTGHANGAIRAWHLSTGKPAPLASRFAGPIRHLCLDPDGSRLLVTAGDGTAHVCETATGQPVLRRLEQPSGIDDARFTADGQRILTWAHRGRARVWDAATGQPISPLLEFTNGAVRLTFSRDGHKLLVVNSNHFARVWNVSSGQPLSPPVGHPSTVVDAEFSPDGTRVVTSCRDDSLAKLWAQVWDATTGELVAPPLQHEDGVATASFSPDGKQIVTASEDGTAGIWDAQHGRLLAPLLRHSYQVYHAAFSPDGRFVVTASRDLTARVWDSRTGEPVTPLLPHHDRVFFAAFSPSATHLVTLCRDGTAHLWNLAPETRPVDQLVQLNQLLNSRQIDSSGAVLPIDTARLRHLWEDQQNQSPAQPDNPPTNVEAWHRTEAADAEANRYWFAAVHHLEHLLKLDPGNAVLQDRLARAQTALAKQIQP